VEGETKPCPHCRQTLVFQPRYRVLAIGLLMQPGAVPADRIRFQPAWVCRNGGCVYRELGGERSKSQ
jgi:hypothetical protein